MKTIIVLMLTLFILPANARVFKCKVNGQTKYQEIPCPKGSSGGRIAVRPNVISTEGLRRYIEQDRIPKMQREQKERNRMASRQAHFNREMDKSAHIYQSKSFESGNGKIVGTNDPKLASFQRTMLNFMETNQITAGSLAVLRNGRLVFAQGYDIRSNKKPVSPKTPFRVASISKPITATATLILFKQKRLNINKKITEIINLNSDGSSSFDNRINDITVRDLLTHRGGWDIKQLGFDPMFKDRDISKALDTSLPISKDNIIHFMSRFPLSFDPGTKYAYSNYGYMLLGRIIEKISGQKYEEYVQKNLLRPLKMNQTYLGKSDKENVKASEVEYLSDYTSINVLDSSGVQTPWPYGGWNIENMDSHGGWVSSAVDIAKFMSAFDSKRSKLPYGKSIKKLIFQRPSGAQGNRYYAMGWNVFKHKNGSMNTWHTGSLDGTLGIMVRRNDGVSWIAIFNRRENKNDPTGKGFWDIDGLLHKAANAVRHWPNYNIFSFIK